MQGKSLAPVYLPEGWAASNEWEDCRGRFMLFAIVVSSILVGVSHELSHIHELHSGRQ